MHNIVAATVIVKKNVIAQKKKCVRVDEGIWVNRNGVKRY